MGRAGPIVPPPRPELPDLDVPERAALLRLVPVHPLPCQPYGTAVGHGSRIIAARRDDRPVRLAAQLPRRGWYGKGRGRWPRLDLRLARPAARPLRPRALI